MSKEKNVTLRVWKFMITEPTPVPGTDNEWADCLAVAIAATQEDAQRIIEEYAAVDGLDVSWLSLARVVNMAIGPRFVALNIG